MTDDQNPYAANIADEMPKCEPLLLSMLRAVGFGIAAWFITIIVLNVLLSFPPTIFRYDANWLNSALDITFLYAPTFVGFSAAGLRLYMARQSRS